MDGKHVVFGSVTAGLDVVKAIEKVRGGGYCHCNELHLPLTFVCRHSD